MAVPLTGTHTATANPWDTYAEEMDTKMSPELAAAVEQYAEMVYDADQSSSENREELARQKEMSDELAEEYQFLKKEEYDDAQARIGTPMTHAEFINKLRKAGIACHYRQHVHADKADLYVALTPGAEPTVQCWVQQGFMQELSVMNFDDHGVPTNERRRGWRTPLLQLILKGIITEEKANQTFGKPKMTDAYHRYNALLQSFRNAGSSLGE